MTAIVSLIKRPASIAVITLMAVAGLDCGSLRAEESASVIVVRATNACFSDMVRVTGFVVPRREAVANVDTEGSKVTEVLVHEGDTVANNQELRA